ncbi:MAG: hypothetical protein C5B55_01120 [Blastocatellia bacterium]|nr:MAG: hypothetical protein C5B55_01120 [Blastocatellia bacterium]
MTVANSFESLFHVRILFQGRDRDIELRVPEYEEVFALILPPEHRSPERMSVMFPAEFKRLIKSMEGSSIDIEHARAIYADSQAAGQLVASRNRLFETLAEQGLIYMQCPHCLSWEAEVSVTALTTALQAGPWPIIDQRLFLAVPSLAQHFPKFLRTRQFPYSSRIRFQLPSTVVGIPAASRSGVLGYADAQHGAMERAAWQRWTPSEVSGREQWREDVSGFHAALRLSVALQYLDGVSGEITPEAVLQMPAIDFYFLDNLHYLAHNVAITDEIKVSVRCEKCGQTFVLAADAEN